MHRPSPYFVSAANSYQARIESEACVTVIVTCFDEDDDLGPGYFARAVTDDDFAGAISLRTRASAWGNSEEAALDGVAKELGVFERITREAITAKVAAGAVRLADVVGA